MAPAAATTEPYPRLAHGEDDKDVERRTALLREQEEAALVGSSLLFMGLGKDSEGAKDGSEEEARRLMAGHLAIISKLKTTGCVWVKHRNAGMPKRRHFFLHDDHVSLCWNGKGGDTFFWFNLALFSSLSF